MKCSDCGKEIKPVVAIDIDGTLGDYHGHFLKFASAYLQHWPAEKTPYDGSLGFKEWFCQRYGTTEEVWHDIKLAYRQGGMKRSMPLLEGATDIYNMALICGAEIWLTTTRPFLRLDNIDPDTRFWLRRNGFSDYYGLLYDEHKYRVLGDIVDKERVVAIVDDLAEQYDSAREIFGDEVPILRRGLYNRGVTRPNTAYDGKGTANAIRKRIYNWRASQHDPGHKAG